jgi:hypothetical protein
MSLSVSVSAELNWKLQESGWRAFHYRVSRIRRTKARPARHDSLNITKERGTDKKIEGATKRKGITNALAVIQVDEVQSARFFEHIAHLSRSAYQCDFKR